MLAQADIGAVSGHDVLGRGLDVSEQALDHAALEDIGSAGVSVGDSDDSLCGLITPSIGGAGVIAQLDGLLGGFDRRVVELLAEPIPVAFDRVEHGLGLADVVLDEFTPGDRCSVGAAMQGLCQL